jgi:glycosyltransferase involved in cell wall biosynthesis
MKLVFVTAALPTSSVEAFLIAEFDEAARLGHELLVVPVRPHGPIVHAEARRFPSVLQPLLSPAIVARAIRELVRAPRDVLRVASILVRASRGLDVMLKNLAVLPKGLWLASVARAAHSDHIHACFASTSASVAYIASAVSKIPWSFTGHRWDIAENNLLAEKGATARFIRAIDERGMRSLAHHASPHGAKVRELRMGVVLPGAAPPLAATAHAPEVPTRGSRPLRVIVGARLAEVKGHVYALEALAQLVRRDVDVTMDFAGDGPLRDALEQRARSLGIATHVTFLGAVDHTTFLADMTAGRWDIAMLPSIENDIDWEGIPVFLVEAMATRIPVIATNTGGIPQLLDDGAGTLVPQRDPTALADALLALTDPQTRHALGARGFARVSELHDVRIVVRELLDRIATA